jgi:hypothetical protein
MPSFREVKERIDANLTNQAFVNKLVQLFNISGVYPTYVVAAMVLESYMDPSARNPNGGATGLIQFYPNSEGNIVLGGQSISTRQMRTLTAVQQMDWVIAYFRQYSRYKNAIQTGGPGAPLALIFLPGRFISPVASIQKVPGDIVLTLRSDKGVDPDTNNYYNWNKGYDFTLDGYITVNDLRLKIFEAIRRYGIPLTIGNITAPDTYIPRVPIVDPSDTSAVISATTPQSFENSGTTPYIASYKSFHPKIQYELTKRKRSTETVKSYMPFVNLTSLTYVYASDVYLPTTATEIPDDTRIGYCPSIGPHGSTKLNFEDIYSSVDNTRSTVGYVTINSPNQNYPRIQLKATSTDIEPSNIPTPGIVNVQTERSTAGPMGVRGGLTRSTVQIRAYSVGQVDTLMRYFLRPGTYVVLELGHLTSKDGRFLSPPFNWRRPLNDRQNEETPGILTELQGILVDIDNGLQDKLTRKYVYDNLGNYEIFIGTVVKFNIKFTKLNTYEIDVVIHSTQQFEVNNLNTGVLSACNSRTQDPCRAIDFQEYFSPEYSWKDNHFLRTISRTTNRDGVLHADWSTQVIPVKDTTPSESPAGVLNQPTSINNGDGTYLISWKYFVDVILNNEEHGLLSVFPAQLRQFMKKTVISDKTTNIYTVTPSISSSLLIPNEVGYHPNLRSIDPGVMVIYNSVANQTVLAQANARLAEESLELAAPENAPVELKLKLNGDFAQSSGNPNVPGSGFLTQGVWLNSNAIIEAFAKTDNISQALQVLLTAMNNSVKGYWNLQVASSDASQYTGMHIVDMGLSKNIYDKVSQNKAPDTSLTTITETQNNINDIINTNFGEGDTPKYIYSFNNKNRKFDTDDIGSELLDININADMPLAIMTQIIAGVGGSTERGTIDALNLPELKILSMFPVGGKAQICPPTATEPSSVCYNNPAERLSMTIQSLDREKEKEISSALETCKDDQEECDKLIKRIENKYNTRVTSVSKEQETIVTTLQSFKDFGNVVKYIELNPARMLRFLNLDAEDGNTTTAPGTQLPTAHAFNSSNLTKIIVDLTMPGIGGIQLWQSFYIERVPKVMKGGFMVVTKVAHEFDIQRGWITKLQGRYRHTIE